MLRDRLVLASYLRDLFGDADEETTRALQAVTEAGRRGDGQSHFFSTLEARASKLGVGLAALRRYDLNVLSHLDAVRARRPDVKGLLYFQYHAALCAEVLLDRLTNDPGGLLADIEAFRRAHPDFADVPAVTADTLRTWAFWMATGSGKTILLHLAVRQFEHYQPFKAENVLLLTPGEGLTRQHLDEFAKSGIPAVHASQADAAFRGVQVVEITRLYDDTTADGQRRSGKGVSIPLSLFEGPNLVLVDEGHKGTFGAADMKEERSWRTLREKLGADGLTVEYSATFGQVADADESLGDFYARTVAFEYAYGRFHADGYGKDYRVLNLKSDADGYGPTVMLGGLLALYAQRRAYDGDRAALATYHVAQPLMVFVGAKVTGGETPEVVQVLAFLDAFLGDRAATVARIEAMLTGQSGLSDSQGGDAFAEALDSLAGLGAGDVYDDLCRRLFHGSGRLQLRRLARADGEVALRVTGTADDAYFGLVSVGNVTKLIEMAEESGLDVGEDDAVHPALFDTLRADEGPLSVLVGARRFLEGWSTPRVSVMGLLGVGRSAGSQVIQLFGRGVRLFGKNRSLKRSAGTPGAPDVLALLETLRIFGLKADYVQTFLNDLDREGAPSYKVRFPIDTAEATMATAKLRLFRKSSESPFAAQPPLSFDFFPAADTPFPSVKVTCAPTVTITADGETMSAKTAGFTSRALPLDQLNEDDLFYEALAHKARKGYANLFVPRAALGQFLREAVEVSAPADVLDGATAAHRLTLDRLARKAVQDGLDAFYGRYQRRYEAALVVPDVLGPDHANIPRDETGPAYRLGVAKSDLARVESLVADATERRQEDTGQPVPRLHIDAHLYAPLLSANAFTVRDGQLHQWGARAAVAISPTGLVESEVRFVLDLREFWQTAAGEPEWAGCEVYLLRNLPKTGLEFYGTAGFYPDFALWIVRGAEQALAFVDPKGMVHWAEEKVGLLAFMETMSRPDLAIRGFIVTPTDPADITLPAGETDKVGYMRRRNVLLQRDAAYLAELLTQLRRALPSAPEA